MSKPPPGSEIKGPTRDKLEVGLARHEKAGRRVPLWIEEKFGIITVALAVLCVVIWASYRSRTPSVADAQIAVISGPIKIWREDAPTLLRAVQTRIRNAGTVPANGVLVTVSIDGQLFQLPGPAVIAPGQIATYEGLDQKFVVAPEPLSGSVTCDNCD